MEKGADINKENEEDETPLFLACKNGNEDLVKYLIDHIADVDKVINKKYENGNTLLIIATLKRKVNLVKYLVERGANVNLSNDHHSTPLTIAVGTREKEIVEYLLKHGAYVHGFDNNGYFSSLNIARIHHFPEIEELLLQYIA